LENLTDSDSETGDPRITSLNNDRVRRVQALLRSTRRRSREGLMVAEGLRLVEELLRSGLPVTRVYYTPDFTTDVRGAALIAAFREREGVVWEVTPEVLTALSATETPQGVVAVLPVPEIPAADRQGVNLVLDGMRDPGNVGTILRAAWASGVRQVLLPPGNVDFTNPKVVRAGMGAHFYLPLRRPSWEALAERVAGDDVWLAEAGEGTRYDRVDWRGAVTLIVGGEAEGAGPQARALAAGRHVTIPMAPGVESLNAAMATSVLLFEAARQRGL
jgi:TrmH family RNA methyltransferase